MACFVFCLNLVTWTVPHRHLIFHSFKMFKQLVICCTVFAVAAATPHGHSHDDLGLPQNLEDRVLLAEYNFPASKDGVRNYCCVTPRLYFCFPHLTIRVSRDACVGCNHDSHDPVVCEWSNGSCSPISSPNNVFEASWL